MRLQNDAGDIVAVADGHIPGVHQMDTYQVLGHPGSVHKEGIDLPEFTLS